MSATTSSQGPAGSSCMHRWSSHFSICRSSSSSFIPSTATASADSRRNISRSTGTATLFADGSDLGFRAQQPAGRTGRHGDLPGLRNSRRARSRSRPISRQSSLPPHSCCSRSFFPGIITGLSLLMLFDLSSTKLSLLTIVLGHGTALISVATTEVFAGLQKLDRAQEEASLDLGANYWQTFWRVTVPNLKLPIIGAALLIFTLSMDEIAVSFFLIGRDNTLPLEIWGRLRRGITPEINAVSTIIFVFSLITIVFWYRLRVRSEGEPEVGLELLESSAKVS